MSRFEERMAHKDRLERLALLIFWPTCGFICPKGKEFGCGCGTCARYCGMWRTDERKQFSDEQNAFIDSCWDKDSGYLAGPFKDFFGQPTGGCKLPPGLRPFDCLKHVCGKSNGN